MCKPQILIAEDDYAMRTFLDTALRRAGYVVNAFPSGDAASASAGRDGYGLLLTDIDMPGMDGVDLARQLTNISPGLRVLFVTGFTERAHQASDVLAQGARVLSKPFKLADLIGQVENMIKTKG